jgi:hypothetical protein
MDPQWTQLTQHHYTFQNSVTPLHWHMHSQPWQTTHSFQSENCAMKGTLSLLQLMTLLLTWKINPERKQRVGLKSVAHQFAQRYSTQPYSLNK